LALRQAAATQRGYRSRRNLLGRQAGETVLWPVGDDRHEPPPDRIGGLDRNLLAYDRSRQRREGVAPPREMNTGIAADQTALHSPRPIRPKSFAGIFRPARRDSILAASPTCTRTRSTKRSSSACSLTIIWRDRRSSCRWRPKPCPK